MKLIETKLNLGLKSAQVDQHYNWDWLYILYSQDDFESRLLALIIWMLPIQSR